MIFYTTSDDINYDIIYTLLCSDGIPLKYDWKCEKILIIIEAIWFTQLIQ